jgi:uncharacterized coiled-coil protein SlyX
MSEGPLEQIQSKIAFLENSIAELSDAMFRQHQEIQAVVLQLKAIRERLEGQERPPHY